MLLAPARIVVNAGVVLATVAMIVFDAVTQRQRGPTLLRSLDQGSLDATGPGPVVLPGGRTAPRAN